MGCRATKKSISGTSAANRDGLGAGIYLAVFHERHLAFESWDALARVLTGKRMALLRYVHRHQVGSVRALAKALERDYSNVHADVQALTAAGLLDATGGGVRADYDAIENHNRNLGP